MEMSAVSGSASLATAKASKGLADNFDTFLVLLTTQLKNQDPLAPMDSSEFTNQLVQFSSVEQQIQANKNLESLIAMTGANAGNATLGYLGREVRIESNQANLAAGSASWTYQVDPGAVSSVMVVKNAAGRIIFSRPGEIGAGAHEFNWDGKDINGIAQPDAVYTAQIVTLDKDGNAANAKLFSTGVVDGVEMLTGAPVLTIGGIKATLGSILSIALPAAGG